MSSDGIEFVTTVSVKDEEDDSFGDSKKEEDDSKVTLLCRLCGQTVNSGHNFLFERNADDVKLIEKVNVALPVHITVQDKLPKHICVKCVDYLNKTYSFTHKVLEAQKLLTRCCKPSVKDECCPLCYSGHMKALNKKTASSMTAALTPPSVRRDGLLKKDVVVSVSRNSPHHSKKEATEYFENDEVVTGYWDPSTSSHSDTYGMKKFRKRNRNEDDQDWTIDEEYLPVSRRGRPKGTKNKPKKKLSIRDQICLLCGWYGPEQDSFAHAINQHCQPDLGYFPCPLCKSNQDNEMILEIHINRHLQHPTRKVKVET